MPAEETMQSVNHVKIQIIDEDQCTINVEINNVTLKALIDSGATSNFMSKDLFDRINNPNLNNPLTEFNGEVRIANQQPIPSCGYVELAVTISNCDYIVKFNVLEGPLLSEVILGWKGFLTTTGANLLGKERCLSLPIQPTKLGVLFTIQDHYLEPLIENLITTHLRCRPESKTQEIFIDKFTELFDRAGVVVSSGIHCMPDVDKNPTLSIILTNLTNNVVCVPANTVVAIAKPHDKPDELSNIVENYPSRSIIKKLTRYQDTYKKQKIARLRRFEQKLFVLKDETSLTLINHIANRPIMNIVTNKEGKLVKTVEQKKTSCKPESTTWNIQNDKLTASQIREFEQLLEDEKDIFTTGTRPSQAVGVAHSIELESQYIKPVHCNPGRPSKEERDTISKQIAEMLANGVIKESRSPWSSRIVLIKKKDGKLRFCIDYRKLNSLTKSDVYPLPRIDDSLAALQKGQFFTTLDMFAGYWQIPMDESSKEKTAFISESGLYQFEVMPFGLKTAGATFQRFMDAVLAGLKWKCLLVYLDDIVIFSDTFEQHLIDVKEVFSRLRASGLQLNKTKCHFLKDKFAYLGHIVSEKGIEPDPKKIEAIINMKIPENAADIRSILGSCSYFRKFIPNFAKLSAPLYKLTVPSNKFTWDRSSEEALTSIKQHLTSKPILCHPNFDFPFYVQTDACDIGIGAVLLQKINNEER